MRLLASLSDADREERHLHPRADHPQPPAGPCESDPLRTGPGLARVDAWFAARGWTAWRFQRDAWRAHAKGHSGLIHVPTGAGKTYAAFGGPLAQCLDEADAPGRGGWTGRGLRVLYVTPLRAVSRDIEKALRLPIEAMDAPVSVESRTGDTSSSVRARQSKSLPNVLITTPESLSLLLTKPESRTLFKRLHSVILDEWHELLATKRGTQTELACARLRRFAPGLKTWALTATISNVGEAARAAAGELDADPRVIRADIERPVRISTVLPHEPDAFPWAGHLGLSLLPEVLSRLDPARATLLFVNTRSQAEQWFSAIAAARPAWESQIGLHHGSVDRGERERVEAGLKSGELRLVVATSSLDLGVDFSPVERVFQIGSPKGIARLIQRAGRSAHRPGEACSITCVPTHGLEMIEVAAARRSLAKGTLEPRAPLEAPLDVLAQHMVTCALGGGFSPGALYDEVCEATGYANLTREDFDWTLALVERGGGTLRAYPEFCKITPDESGLYRMPSRRLAQLHRFNVGTIAGDSTVSIRYLRGRALGSIEETFVQRLRSGERFVFAGKTLSFVRLRDGVAYVRPASGRTKHTPHWAGTRLPISESMSDGVRDALEAARDGDRSIPEFEAAAAIIEAQTRLSAIPDADCVLAESVRTREGRHVFLFPFEGRLVHTGLAALLAYRLSRAGPVTLSIAANDYGLELLTPDTSYDFRDRLGSAVLTETGLARDIVESVNLGELARGQFREVARVAGLVFQSYPGGHKSGRQLNASSGLIYDVLRDFDPEHLLLAQAEREVMEREFERARLARTLARLRASRWVWQEPARPTPLGLPLIIEREGGQLSSEQLRDRIRRVKASWCDDPAAAL
jgi:ATP-dependent Lhr-like helicase